ncbi:MAG TPA: carbohydrate ABC transporter permease [Bradyrhizobium sp.]|nr:carbohydrate ABC transporter permease [Bradyrhizobium sp.]
MYVAVCATVLSIVASVLAAYAIVRLRYRGAQWVGGLIFMSYLVPPSILFIPLATVVFQYGLFDSPMALILTYPTILIPFSTWLLMGYFKTIPFELEECALIDGASRWQILTKIVLPLAIIVFVLLFPFYWMGLTAIKPDEQLLDLDKFNPFWTWNPTFKHIHKLLFESYYPWWLWNTMYVAVCATVLSIVASVLAAYAIVRLRYRGAQWVGGLIFMSYLVPPSILFIPLATVVFQYGLFDSPLALILTYPTILIPFSTWLLMGYFKTIPYELEECALIDGASRWQILTKIVLPLAIPGLISAFIFCFTLCWNEFIYALTFLQSTANKTVPVAIVNEFVDGDVYRWGSLMAGALAGSLPLVILYAFFVEHYVSAMTGAVKE